MNTQSNPRMKSADRLIPAIIVNLIGSVLMAVALIGLSSCGKDSTPVVPHPAEQLPNKSVPLPLNEPDLADVASASATVPNPASACQVAVVPGSDRDYLCCTENLSPAGSPTCAAGYESTSRQCSLSFQNGPGVLWSCGPEKEDPSAFLAEVTDEELRRSAASEDYRLHRTAERLGMMEQSEYLGLQYHYMKSREPACNFFLITALCQAGYCESDMPWYLAAEFDRYFNERKWELLTLDQLKAWFIAGVTFDSVLQKDGVSSSKPGHVAIPVGLGARDRLYIAQGSLGTVTNEVKPVSDSFVLEWNGGFRIFVKAK